MRLAEQSYRGRFAPSPTGPLHFGSLVAAMGSYLDAKFHNGKWLVRIEDVDCQRAMPGAVSEILTVLESFGFEWDEEVVYQSRRSDAYRYALSVLEQRNRIYPCACSRKEIADSSIRGLGGLIYPGTCRDHPPRGKESYAMRIRVTDEIILFHDRIKGSYSQKLSSDIGDFVLRRADGIFSYQLAVVTDDALQNITHVVRGADLLDSTPRQIFLQRLLGFPTPHYLHLPVVTNAFGEKLSKQTNAAPIQVENALPQLIKSLQFLGQPTPVEMMEGDIASFWQWAQQNWRVHRVPSS
ncbi:tRNA glutamyl-Q(34) synthetase GluQRS [Nitrosomonas sp.]|uniref:tRNA glutamyl-Q(34) synthetase GluQRS n=1 Tax=Nitrosomonas sp. TaxID=42353 RepID=UPI001DE60A72|nr:tRNA glutamyl-Q(34) synthetase GluQRS [Nitrosomonas sp.]MBX3616478.1 tRNA glutamyl-Q(34) synthetase GluQRS [Nitrosomonas sp.]